MQFFVQIAFFFGSHTHTEVYFGLILNLCTGKTEIVMRLAYITRKVRQLAEFSSQILNVL